MKIYSIISVEVYDGSFPVVETRVTDNKKRADEIFNEEKSKAQEEFDEDIHEINNDDDTSYSYYDMEDPMYNYKKVEIIESELE